MIFTKFNPRKAKFGFRCTISLETLEEMAEAKKLVKQLDPTVHMEFDTNMGHDEFRIYTNDQAAAERFEATSFCRD